MSKWLLLIMGIGLIPRCWHLLNDNHYVLGSDSYLFHYLAQNTGDPVISNNGYPLHSGLTYPVYGLSKIIGIEAASCIVPILIYLLTFGLLYLFVNRYWGKTVAVTAVVVFALIPQSVVITSAGYLDRDGISLLLVLMTMMVAFWYFSIPTGDRLLCGWQAIIGIGLLQWLQWHGVGVVMIFALALMVLLINILPKYRIRYIVPIMLVIGLIVYGLGVLFVDYIGFDQSVIGEVQPIRLVDLFLWWGMAVPLVIVGWFLWIYYTPVPRRDAIVFVWFIIVLAASAVVSRVIIMALPAVCIISGLSVRFALEKYYAAGGGATLQARFSRIATMVIIGITLVVTSTISVLSLQTNHRMAVNADWQAALGYLRAETPVDARIAVLGDQGYWVMDLADRRPVSYGGPRGELDKIGVLYCTEFIDEFYQVMQDMECDYFVYSDWEYEAGPIFRQLADAHRWAQDIVLYSAEGQEYYDYIYNHSVARRSLSGDVLPVVYRNGSVVIIKGRGSSPPSEQVADCPDQAW